MTDDEKWMATAERRIAWNLRRIAAHEAKADERAETEAWLAKIDADLDPDVQRQNL